MRKETKDIIRPLIESIAAVTEKQAVVLQLLAAKLPLSEDEKRKLLSSAQENEKRAQGMRQSAQSLEDDLLGL